MLLRKRFLSLAAVASLAVAGVACSDDGATTDDTLEETGDTVEEGAEDTGDAVEDGAEDMESEMEEETTEGDS